MARVMIIDRKAMESEKLPERMKLVSKETGLEVLVGAQLVTFRGEPCILISSSKPHKLGSTGRIYVRESNGFEGEYYPSVCGLEFVEA